jgi:predicted CoA-substrate-specific enzyme activase
VVVFDGENYSARIRHASWKPGEIAADMLAALCRDQYNCEPPPAIAATGYGRKNCPDATSAHTEIACHARGGWYLAPGCRFVIDIGGQDAKGIRVADGGRVEDFVMNDKCAAGTGRFLSAMGQALGIHVDLLSKHALGVEPHRINAMCTVFAESEVIGLINEGVSRGAIIAGLHDSIARRTASMIAPLHPQPPVVFTGGVSQNTDLVARLKKMLGHEILVPKDAVFAGALGAALIAWDNAGEK